MMQFRTRLPILATAILASLSLATVSLADQNLKVLDFKTSVGSFKLLGSEHPAHGRLEISFTGTVLVSGLTSGTVTPSGGVGKEYDNAQHKKQVFHGKGKIVVDGEFEAIQFFGRDLTGTFTGLGIFRLYGEFDKNLNTGDYWYEGGEHHDWGTGGSQLTVPGYNPAARAAALQPPVKIKEAPKH
jgi:hypothetical protein